MEKGSGKWLSGLNRGDDGKSIVYNSLCLHVDSHVASTTGFVCL